VPARGVPLRLPPELKDNHGAVGVTVPSDHEYAVELPPQLVKEVKDTLYATPWVPPGSVEILPVFCSREKILMEYTWGPLVTSKSVAVTLKLIDGTSESLGTPPT
jgi:hypothetical protein